MREYIASPASLPIPISLLLLRSLKLEWFSTGPEHASSPFCFGLAVISLYVGDFSNFQWHWSLVTSYILVTGLEISLNHVWLVTINCGGIKQGCAQLASCRAMAFRYPQGCVVCGAKLAAVSTKSMDDRSLVLVLESPFYSDREATARPSTRVVSASQRLLHVHDQTAVQSCIHSKLQFTMYCPYTEDQALYGLQSTLCSRGRLQVTWYRRNKRPTSHSLRLTC